jgi:prophage regulatory protein
MSTQPYDRIVRMKELPEIVGYSRASIYRRIAEGTFVAPLRLGPNTVGWRLSTIQAWLESLETAA